MNEPVASPHATLTTALRVALDPAHAAAHAPRLREQLTTYLELLVRWGRTFNLVGKPEPGVVLGHLLDCLAIHAAVRQALALPAQPQDAPAPRATLYDIGSGAGLPGIVLALTNPDLHWVLVEPNGKKTAFQQHAIGALGLGNCTAWNGRIEDLAARADPVSGVPPAPPCDVGPAHFITRAYATLDELLDCTLPHLAPGAHLLAMKAARTQDEIRAITPRLRAQILPPVVLPIAVPDPAQSRTLVVLTRATLAQP